MAKGPQFSKDTVVTNPSDMDVLCSKDKSVAKHPGNVIFRERIEDGTAPYSVAVSKQEKMKITREIVAFMRNKFGSRFLKQKNGEWVEINDQTARDKVSHALRFAARNLAGTTTPPPKRTATQPRRRKRSISSQSSSSDETLSTTQSSVASGDCAVHNYHDGHRRDAPTVPGEDADAPLASIYMRQQDILSHLQNGPGGGDFDFHDFHIMGLGHADPEPEFNTLRSEDLNELLREPMFSVYDEWEAVEYMAQC